MAGTPSHRPAVLVALSCSLARDYLSQLCAQLDCRVQRCQPGQELFERLEGGSFELIVSDLAGVAELKRRRPDAPPCVVVARQASVDFAVKAMRAGAVDVLVEPVGLDELAAAIHHGEPCEAIALGASEAEASEAAEDALVGRSVTLNAVRQRIQCAAPSKATVLLQGESGTGKERLAEMVHRMSKRADGPFVKVNCAALAEGVLESELFGHEQGAFTGAHQRRIGRFEAAHGGTLLLDEVSEVSPAIQAKLLRVLEEEELQRVGGNRTISVDVRVVATTNRDLETEVARGTFRHDLFFRLAVVPIRVPPLRERAGDVPLLVNHFLEGFRHETNSRVRRFSPAALAMLEQHRWSGNVRELQNLVRRLVLLDVGETIGDELVRRELLGFETQRPASLQPCTIAAAEREAIKRALAVSGGNRGQAARILGISVRTLFNRLKRYEEEDGVGLVLPKLQRAGVA